MSKLLFGGLECGGTTFKCAVGDADGAIVNRKVFDTTSPEETLRSVIDFLSTYSISSLAVGSFGPVDIMEQSKTYGLIQNTPKELWRNFNIRDYLVDRLKIPVTIHSDVAVAAVGEYWYGQARGVDRLFYMTIGTGIGGVMLVDGLPFVSRNGRPIEVGHMYIPGLSEDKGSCHYHRGCLEGLASGSALQQKWMKPPNEINEADAWERESKLLAIGVHNISMVLQPDVIVLGGGIMKYEGLIDKVRHTVADLNGGYIDYPTIDNYIIPSFGDMNGVKGAIKIASTLTS